VPVVAAIGHETDTTIAELVADERCATPTQAAMRLTPDRAALLRQIDASIRRLSASVSGMQREERHRLSHATMRLVAGGERQLNRRRERLTTLQRRLDRLHPRVLHAETLARVSAMATRLRGAILTRLSRESVEPAAQRLRRAMQVAIEAHGKEVAAARRALEAISPRKVLERGYSLTTDAQGVAVRDAGVLRAGDELVTTFASGSANSIVKVAGGGGPKNVADIPPATQKRRVTVELRPAADPKPRGDQMGLF
jgi:exodeoxyribonuclease VII large subunit